MSLIFAALLTPLNDVTTTFDPAPEYVYLQYLVAQKGKPLTYDPAHETTQRKLYPDLKPLATAMDAAALFQIALQVAKAQNGWKVLHVDTDHFHLEAVATSRLLRFKDDVVIEIRTDGEKTSSLHMRSRSRVGRSDLGANYKRIRGYLEQVKDKF